MKPILDDLFGKDVWPKERCDREKEIYPHFRVKLAIMKYRPPRHPYFEFTREMGMPNIEKVFNKEPLSGSLTFVFPERWMSVHEQQAFMFNLTKNPTVEKITSVNIVTSCPMLVSDFNKEAIHICTFEDDKEY